ncbi:tRNA (adenosine(37)-N6)-threonylcarbamoyltransferase complex ATPase subunit type 1 TsaE [uncultured Hymenobacter sp.]|uniref:tRNA (adenosine(37)-N6)-threonylcarbamoyltransferase complex ATPase subunit type 1 TsaE n=1 Tax=uncultured Hymenobacter sp. TaxID=170016 RepID=UPI0035CC2E23
MENTFNISSLADLPAAAAWLKGQIDAANCAIVAFKGEMGAGKTTLIRALCAAMGVGDEVSSPTFALVNEYRDGANQPIYHFDFYRIETPDEALRMGAAEYFDSGYLCLIEWPGRIELLLPSPRLLVQLSVTGPESRQLHVSLTH